MRLTKNGFDRQFVLLNPGPAGTTSRVKQAMSSGDWCHREPEFAGLMGLIRLGLSRSLMVDTTHEAILITGSGTAAMEMAVINSVREGRSLLALRNGVYGDRLAHIAEAHGITVHSVHGRWTKPIDPDDVRAALEVHPDVDAVSCVQHETTTGLINPVESIGAVVGDTDALFVMDAISATAIEDVSHQRSRANVIGGTANKGLHGLPGMSFIFVDQCAEERMREVRRRSVYFDAAAHLDAQRRGEVLFTPAIQVCLAMREALDEYELAGGFRARTAMYRERARKIRDGMAALGFTPIIAAEHRANSVSMFPLPGHLAYGQLHNELRREGFVIYAAQGSFTEGHFRVATMGELPQDAIERFLERLEAVITRHGQVN